MKLFVWYLISAFAMAQQVRLLPLPITSVKIEDTFWAPRIETNRTRTVETVYQRLVEAGNIEYLRIAAGKSQGKYRGPFWADSDVYKWVEGVAYSLAQKRDPAMEAKLDEVISLAAAAQMPDGYLNSYFQVMFPEGRWTFLAFGHEMYTAGHMFEAAVAHYEATGKRTFLDVAIRNADHIERIFGPGKRAGQPGHEEIELGLVKLARATGDARYSRLAKFFIDHRGKSPSFFEGEYQKQDPSRQFEFLGRTIGLRSLYDELFRKDGRFNTEYSQDHKPVREQDKVVGHAVRAMYLYSGMADVAVESGDGTLLEPLVRLYGDMTTKRQYLTGGIGPSAHNEGFTTDYDLPNETAYQETCASIGVMMWTQRMLSLTGDGRFAETMEQALFNAFPAGVAFDGQTFFYDNPLYSAGKTQRRTWFAVPCCPTNMVRMMPSLGKFAYAQTDDALWLNTYVESTAATEQLTLVQRTSYPWSGKVSLKLEKAPAGEYGLHLRVPEWAGAATVLLNGRAISTKTEKGYAKIRRNWRAGDEVQMEFPMEVQRIEAHPAVAANRGRIALRRGPVVYTLEQADNETDVDRIVIPWSAKLTGTYDAKLLGGVGVITGTAMRKPAVNWESALYQPAPVALEGPVPIRAVPYGVWANRGPGKMAVWIETR